MKRLFIGLQIKLQQEYKEFRAIDISSQLFLGACLIYFVTVILYIGITKNYYELWLMWLVPLCSLPLLMTFLPEARKYKNIDKFIQDIYEQNQEIAFFYIVGLVALIWSGFIWGTDIITLDYDHRITLTLQSITASLAPLAFYIAYKNYTRKSGVKFIVKIKRGSSYVYPYYIKELIFLNEKDRSNVILKMYITFDGQYITELRYDESDAVIKAYDAHTFLCHPFTYYIALDRVQGKSVNGLNMSIENVMNMPKTIIIETTQGWYKSNDFSSFNDNILLDKKIVKPNFPIDLSGMRNKGYILTTDNKRISFMLPSDFIAIIIFEDKDPNALWVYVYDNHSNEAKVFRAIFSSQLDMFYINSRVLKDPDFPGGGVLDCIDKADLQDVISFEKWRKQMHNSGIAMEFDKIHLITPSIYDRNYKNMSSVVSN